MSTKNLSRTIIEGGRHKSNKWDRHHSHAEERAHLKNYLGEVMEDLENYYEYDIEPIRHVGKGFDDKLAPIYRWLRAQVGQPWDDVRSKLFETFDTRTTAGRHIVFDHLLQSVQVDEEEHRRYYYGPDDHTASYSDNDYYVDETGILQKKRYINRRFNRDKVPPFDVKRISNWLSGRIVGKVGNKYFWFIPADKSKKRGGWSHTWKIQWGYRDPYAYQAETGPVFLYLDWEVIYKTDSLGQRIMLDGKPIELDRIPKWTKNYGAPNLRQGRKLDAKDLEFWGSLPEYYQRKILECSPNYPKEPRYDYWGRRIS